MIEIGYYYKKGDKWILCFNHFHNTQKALRFLFVLKNRANMVFNELHCDDPYDDQYLRRKAGL